MKIIAQLFLVIFSVLVLSLSIRGLPGSPTVETMNNVEWTDDGPLELSPERGRFALLYSVVEDKTPFFSLSVARLALPDLGYINGKFVSLFAPGLSYLIAPGYLVGKYLGSSQVGAYAVISIFAVLNTLLIYRIAVSLKASKTAALIASLIFLFATPAYAYAVALYQHHVSTFILLICIYLLQKNKGFFSQLVAWMFIALSIPLDYPNLVILFPVGIYLLSLAVDYTKGDKDIKLKIKPLNILAMIGVVPPLLFFLWFNQLSYGNPLQFSGTVQAIKVIDEAGAPVLPEIVPGEAKSAISFFKPRNMLNGLYIHTTSPDRGILWYAPVLLFGILGTLLYFKTSQSPIAVVIVGAVLANILLYAMWGDPWGGWAFGSRYLIPSYALLSIMTAYFLTKYAGKTLVLLIFALVAFYSISVNTIGALTSNRNPPQVEVLSLEALSGKQEKYSFDRNVDMLRSNKSKSLFFQTVGNRYLSAWEYYLSISLLLGSVMAILVVVLRLRHRS